MAIWTPSTSTKPTAKKQKSEGSKDIWEIEVPAARLEDAKQNVFVRLQLKAKVQGFRPGKAPLDIIKRQYGQAAEAEAVEDVLRAVVPEIIKENELKPITMPQVAAVDFRPGQPLKFELHVENAPNFTPKGYSGLSITENDYKVEDKEVESRLEQLREGNARLDTVEEDTVAKEHYAVVDFEMKQDGNLIENGTGKGELVDMSSDQTVEGLVQGILGQKRGESRSFKVKIEGKETDCELTVKEIKKKNLPSLDDEFAKDLGFEKLDELKAKLREIAEGEYTKRSERELQRDIEEKVLEANKFEVPTSMVDQQADYMVQRLFQRLGGPNNKLSEEQSKDLREKMRGDAEKSVRLQFIIAEIAKKDKIEASDEDFKKELENALAQSEDDKQKEDTNKFFEERKEEIMHSIKERKVLESIRKSAKIKKVSKKAEPEAAHVA